jgi:hypothetical protein
LKRIVVFLLLAQTLYAQEVLQGSLYFSDGTKGRVSHIDMITRGKPGMTMTRSSDRKTITITQVDIDYSKREAGLDGTIIEDEEGNIIIIISATHRRIITPSGEMTEVFEDPAEFTNFFYAFAQKYPRVIKAVDSKGRQSAYVAVKNARTMYNRIYMRVKPYEEICIIESINYPIQGYAYHEMRATDGFVQRNPDAVYFNGQPGKRYQPTVIPVSPTEDSYFSFIQGAGSADANTQVNVSSETAKMLESKKDISEITAEEMEALFDGSLLNAEVIVGKGEAVSTSTFDRIRSD